FKHITLVHGVRLNADLSYQTKITQLQQQYPQLHYLPVVSREPAIIGLDGRITSRIADDSLFAHCHNAVTPDNAQFMICGNPDMVKDTSALLTEQGYTRNRRREPGQITVEQYW
ncbi:hypothetical protein LCGC14_3154370, partial [marine sediment metagenome]